LALGLIMMINSPIVRAACDPNSDEICNPLGDLKFKDIINKLIDFLLTVALIICPLMIVIGAFYFITAGGDPTKANKGRQVMIYAIIGLVIILISKGLVNLVKSAVGVTP
jgi:magnesium-transporting ATPase (P-type)